MPHRPSPTPARPRRRLAGGALALVALLVGGALPAAAVDPPSPVVLTVTEGVDRTAGSAEVCLDDWYQAEVYRFDAAANSWVHVLVDVPDHGAGCHVLTWDLGATIPDHAGRYRVVTNPMDLPGTGDGPGDFDVVVQLARAVVTEHPTDTVVTGGETAEFTAAAAPPTSAASPRARPQWQVMVDGTPWSPVDGATGDVWEAGTREADGTALVRAAYTRVPLNAFQIAPEPVYTDPARLTVWASVALERGPRDAEVALDGDFVLDVGEIWGVRPIAFQWEHLAPGAADWEPVPGWDGPEVDAVAGAGVAVDGARFRLCHANAFSARACSADAGLTVLRPAPEVTEHPQSVTALPGEPVDFEAEAVHATASRWESRAPGGDWVPTVRAASDLHETAWRVWAAVDLGGTEYRAVFRGAGVEETASDPALLTVLVLPPVDVSVSAVVRLVDRLPGW